MPDTKCCMVKTGTTTRIEEVVTTPTLQELQACEPCDAFLGAQLDCQVYAYVKIRLYEHIWDFSIGGIFDRV